MSRRVRENFRLATEAPNLPRTVVFAVWAAMTLGALAFVSRYGVNVPYWDEWNMIDVLTGRRAVSLGWLWSEHNGHRIPLPRLLLLGLYHASGRVDFRAGMYFNVLVLSIVTFLLIRSSASQRGHVSYSDAFFPLALLSWTHFENLLWSWQVSQVLPAAIAATLLAIIVRFGFSLTPAYAFVSGTLILSLPFCGVPGLVYAPALSIWLFMAGLFGRRVPNDRSTRVFAWTFAAFAILMSALYVLNYDEASQQLSHVNIRLALRTAFEFLSSGFGSAAYWAFPWSGLLTVLLYLAATMALIVTLGSGRSAMRSGFTGLLLFLTGVTCLTASVAFGRTGQGFIGRYYLLAIPPLCAVYFVFGGFAPLRISSLAQMIMTILLIAALPIGFQEGLNYARAYSGHMRAFLADIERGKTVPELVARHASTLCPCPWYAPSHGIVLQMEHPPRRPYGFAGEGGSRRSRFPVPPWVYCVSLHPWLTDKINLLRNAGIDPFKRIPDRTVVFSETPIGGLPHHPAMADVLHADGVVPGRNIAVVLDAPHLVTGVKVTAKHQMFEKSSENTLQVFWKLGRQSRFRPDQRYIYHWKADEKEHIIWLFQPVDELIVNFDNRDNVAELLDVKVLLPSSAR